MSLPVVTIGSLTFNDGTFADVCEIQGWHDTPGRDAPILPRGGTVGALPGAPFLAKEKYLVLVGARVAATEAEAMAKRTELLAQFSEDGYTEIAVNWGGTTLSARVQLYDASTVTIPDGLTVRFQLPVVQFDPYRYGPPGALQMGAFTPFPFASTYEINTVPNPDFGSRTYFESTAPNPDFEYRWYVQQISFGELPSAAIALNNGDVTTSRLTIEVVGPLTQGEWSLVNETTGSELVVDLTLIAGQSLLIDMYEELATLQGDPVNELVRGDWLRVPPGASVLRLLSEESSAAFANVTIYSAYQ